MKNKIQFIFPRLLAITALLGIVSFILGLLFKILLLGIALGSIALLVGWIVRNWHAGAPEASENQQQMPYRPAQSLAKAAVRPVYAGTQQEKVSIIPIY